MERFDDGCRSADGAVCHVTRLNTFHERAEGFRGICSDLSPVIRLWAELLIPELHVQQSALILCGAVNQKHGVDLYLRPPGSCLSNVLVLMNGLV